MLPLALLAASLMTAVTAQVPQPFPKPGPRPDAAGRDAKRPTADRGAGPKCAEPRRGIPRRADLPVSPVHRFVRRRDGPALLPVRHHRTFADIVQYYRNTLKQRGELVYEQPALHQFDLGRFREESMAFPPSVTVKDYTFGGTGGYLNPKRGAKPARFPTIIQIVPNPPGGDR